MARRHRRYHRRSLNGLGALGEYPPATDPKTVTFQGQRFKCFGSPVTRKGRPVPEDKMKRVVCVHEDRANFLTDQEVDFLRANPPASLMLKAQHDLLKKRIAESKMTASQRSAAAAANYRRLMSQPTGTFIPAIGPLPQSVMVRAGWQPRRKKYKIKSRKTARGGRARSVQQARGPGGRFVKSRRVYKRTP